jgi:hypothetical protein
MLLTELAQQHALTLIATLGLAEALATGPAAVQARITQGLAEDTRLTETGIGVVGVRVVAVKPEADVERALRTPTREQIQQEADKAGFERRALAVERERAISENELQSRIELAIREEQLVAQEGANARRRATEKSAAEAIAREDEVKRIRDIAEAESDRHRMIGAAQAEAESAMMAVYADTDPRLLMALGLRDLAGQLPEIGTLNLSPDVVTSALSRLANGAGPSSES